MGGGTGDGGVRTVSLPGTPGGGVIVCVCGYCTTHVCLY